MIRSGCCRRVDAPDGDDGDGQVVHYFGEFAQALRRSSVRFGAGGIDGAEADVIGPVGDALLRFFEIAARDADDPVGAQEVSGQADREVVLPEVDAVGARGDGHVDPVVDDEGDTGLRADFLHGLCGLDHVAGGAGFLAVLDRVGAAGSGEAGQVEVRVAVLQEGVGEDVEDADFFHRKSPIQLGAGDPYPGIP
jgi:hypothetical protein